jgi:hypothetical protein
LFAKTEAAINNGRKFEFQLWLGWKGFSSRFGRSQVQIWQNTATVSYEVFGWHLG